LLQASILEKNALRTSPQLADPKPIGCSIDAPSDAQIEAKWKPLVLEKEADRMPSMAP
jgi:hypothetical protein